MIFGLLADAVVAVHFTFAVFVPLGGLLVLRWQRVAWLHVPAAVWGVLIELAGLTCPLTPLENLLRARAGRTVYQGGFIEQYLLPVLYPAGLTRSMQLALGIAALAINAVVYWRVLRHRSFSRQQPTS
jgi:hypothetical protein